MRELVSPKVAIAALIATPAPAALALSSYAGAAWHSLLAVRFRVPAATRLAWTSSRTRPT